MKRPRKFVLLLAGLIVLSLIVFFMMWRVEMTYGGMSLRGWTEQFQANINPDKTREAQNAIVVMTTNSLPKLVEDLNYDASLRHNKFPSYLSKFPAVAGVFDKILTDRRQQRVTTAEIAFTALRDQAAPAIPKVTELTYARNHNIANRALSVLSHLGTNGLNALLKIIADQNHPRYSWAVFHIRDMKYLGTNAHPAVSFLVKLALSNDPALDHMATVELGWLGLEPELSIPALQTVLNHSPDPWRRELAAESLSRFGPAASAALSLWAAMI